MAFTLDRWLSGARFEDGLLIPGNPPRGSADLYLGEDRAELRARGRIASLAWEDFRNDLPEYPVVGDAWTIMRWTLGEGDRIGVGAGVTGSYEEPAAAVRRATLTLSNLMSRYGQTGIVVPLRPMNRASTRAYDERRFVAMLCDLASQRPEVRCALVDRDRVERLLGEVGLSSLAAPEVPTTGRRLTLDVHAALHALGFEHRFHGRPLPGEQVADEDDVVESVLRRMRSSPWTKDVKIDEVDVRREVVRQYTSVPPWPVHALLDG